ncbi:HoxN/HupN/NixA family nickel/cobalt transporter [Gordonia humi]|uniref:Nickel/cobalt efflux system n=1 Tax=Gordonia humi TaxID=686429 RepID=A0A840FC49_9ACTN|nr:high-affinity nickel-transport protein [Gordonia humi]MBB4137690.1 high-affinity nickel-transport protein [Gordonia humi]
MTQRLDARVRDPGGRGAVVVIVALHLLGWGLLLLAVVPSGITYASTGPTAVAVGLSAYALGLRHAFDADHIAAIDNTTRRFVDRGRPASTVGLWFSLGHSSVVLLLCLALVVGIGALGRAVTDDDSTLHEVTGVWGPLVSSVFLLLVAAVNIRSLRRSGGSAGGPVWRIVSRVEHVVDRPTRMYAVGFAFGFGFDTATEIGLLALAGSASLGAVPWWAVLTLPILFAAGMSLLDTVQGAVMRRAYTWSPDEGSRVVSYGVLMTGISAAVAVFIALVQLSSVAYERWGWQGPFAWLGGADLETLGFWLTGVLLVTWGAAFVMTRRRIV